MPETRAYVPPWSSGPAFTTRLQCAGIAGACFLELDENGGIVDHRVYQGILLSVRGPSARKTPARMWIRTESHAILK
ncbi:MAG: hypothetical protein ACHRXM_21365 [Isosphaerales bacterium]